MRNKGEITNSVVSMTVGHNNSCIKCKSAPICE